MNAGGMGVGIVFSAVDHASGVMTALSGKFQSLAATSTAARAAVQRNVRMIGMGIAGMIGGMKLVGGAFHAASAFGDFEQGIASIAGITRATMAQMEDLKKAAITAAVQTQFSPKDAVDALQTLAAAGQTATQAMTTLIPALDLAAGSLGQLSVAEAATAIVGTLNSYQMAAEEAVGVTDKLLRITQLTNFQARDFGVALSVAAGKNAAFKQSLTDTLVGLGLLRNANIDASVSQTALTAAFMRIGGESRVTKIVEGVGVAVFDAAGKIRPALDVMGELAEKTRGMTDRKRLEIWSSVFERRGILAMNAVAQAQITTTRANIYAVTAQSGAVLRGEMAYARLRERIMKQGGSLTDHTGRVYRDADAVRFLTEAMDKTNQETVKGMEAINAYRVALEDSGGAAEGYKKVLLDTYKGQLTLLEGAVQSFQVLFGEGFAAALRPAVSALYDQIGGKLVPAWRDMSAGFKKALGIVVSLGGALLAITGTMMVMTGVVKLLGFSFKGLILAMGGMLKMALPIMAIGFLIWNLVAGIRRAMGESSDAVNDKGERVYGFFKRLELIFRSVVEILFSGGLSAALTAELDKGDRGLRVFVNKLSMWIEQTKAFFIAAGKGIQDAGAVIGRVLKSIDDAFGGLMASGNVKQTGSVTEQAAQAMRDASDAGRGFGRTIGFLAGLWATTKIITLFVKLAVAIKAVGAAFVWIRLLGATMMMGAGTMFGAFALGLGIILAIGAAIASIIYYWDELGDALGEMGNWMLEKVWYPAFNWLQNDAWGLFKRVGIGIKDVFLDVVDGVQIMLIRMEIAFYKLIRAIAGAVAVLPDWLGGRSGEAGIADATRQIKLRRDAIKFLSLPQEEQRVIVAARESAGASSIAAQVTSAMATPQARSGQEEKSAMYAAIADGIIQNVVIPTMKLISQRPPENPNRIELVVDGEVLATAVDKARENRVNRAFAPFPAPAR